VLSLKGKQERDMDKPSDTEIMTPQQMFEFFERFSNDVLTAVADQLSTETAYNLLRELSYAEYAGAIRKVIMGYVGRVN
jgi:hypothetical protein